MCDYSCNTGKVPQETEHSVFPLRQGGIWKSIFRRLQESEPVLWGKLFYGVFCKKCFFRKEKAILQKDHGGSVGLINSGNISYRIAGSDQMFSTAVILPGNIASYGGKCSRGRRIASIYMVDQILYSFPQRDISGDNVPENRKYHSGYLPENTG